MYLGSDSVLCYNRNSLCLFWTSMMKENISLNNKHIFFLKRFIDFHFCLGCTKPKENIALILKITKYWMIYKNVEELEIKLPTFTESLKKQESSRKTSTSSLLTMPKSLTVWITINCGKFLKRWEYQITWPAS